MSISSPGVGSGLDIAGIVSQLMAIEQRPLVALQQRETGFHAQISAYGTLKGALESFKSAMSGLAEVDKFQVFKATSADETAFTASASSSANTGAFAIQVTGLAAMHRMASASFADTGTTTIGNAGDTVTITVDGSSFAVDIGGKTLSEIRAAINDATDNVGVTASILGESASSFRLILSSNDTGAAKAIGLAFANGGSPITDPLTMATTVAAADASILVDGSFTVTSSTNTFTDTIEGVTLTVKNTTADNVDLTVTKDTGAINKSAQDFVNAFNSLRTAISGLRAGALKSDNTLLSIERGIRGVLNTAPAGLGGDDQYLAQVGISIQKDGSMAFDSAKFLEALDEDFGGIAQLFANDNQGYAFRLEKLASGMLDTDGLLDARTDGLNASIRQSQHRQEDLAFRLTRIEQRYRNQFSALDTLLGQMQVTSNYLTQQISALTAIQRSTR